MGRRASVRVVGARLRGATCRRVLLGAALAGMLLVGGPLPRSAGSGVTTASADVPPARHLTDLPGGIRIVRAGYQLIVDPRTAVVQVASPAGTLYSSWPLVGIADRETLPPGAVRHVSADGDVVTAEVVAGGATLSRAVLTPGEQWFTVSLEVLPGDVAGPLTRIFSDGHRGVDLGTLGEGFSPDPGQQAHGRTHLPFVDTAVRTPFSPAPFDVQMRSAAGWLGIGLVQLPDATSFGLGPGGALELDSAPAPSAAAPVRLPDVVVTMAVDPLVGLRTYHDAVVSAGAAPAAPARGPAWWHDPIVDTWGAQVAERVARQSPGFTAAWVRSFVDDVKRRYGLTRFTVVIDSVWQAAIGEPAPDAARFGGYAGMRRLVDDLHAQGLHVLLWWPMWARDIAHVPARRADLAKGGPAHLVDPTATGFESTMASTVGRLLGSGPGGLDADGLKLDWAYDLPAKYAHPDRGTGARALHAYLGAIHAAAGTVHAGALVEASAVAPQFQDVADSVRLYDAWHETDWLARAEIVAAADPGELVDGDGWQTDPRDALQHAVASAVYGVPALYFDGRWADGSGVTAGLATEIGQVLSLASLKGDGLAVGGPEGWTWTGTATAAWTLDHERDALVWREEGCGGSGVLVATVAGDVSLPLRVPGRVVVTARGRTVPTGPGTHPHVRVAPATVYQLVATC